MRLSDRYHLIMWQLETWWISFTLPYGFSQRCCVRTLYDMQWHSFTEINALVPWWCCTNGALNYLVAAGTIECDVRLDDTYYRGTNILQAIIDLAAVIRGVTDELDKKSFWES